MNLDRLAKPEAEVANSLELAASWLSDSGVSNELRDTFKPIIASTNSVAYECRLPYRSLLEDELHALTDEQDQWCRLYAAARAYLDRQNGMSLKLEFERLHEDFMVSMRIWAQKMLFPVPLCPGNRASRHG